MPVVDERRIAKAKALRAQGMTQEEIAVELGGRAGDGQRHPAPARPWRAPRAGEQAEEKVMTCQPNWRSSDLGSRCC